MIKFSLKCAQDHCFDSWFQSAAAFDKLAKQGLISCTLCGDTAIRKSVMAPSVQIGRTERHPRKAATPASGALSAPASPTERALAEIRRRIEAHSEYVGADFAREARQIHTGDAPGRAIHGEARADEARALLEDGVPIMPLPFLPARKVN